MDICESLVMLLNIHSLHTWGKKIYMLSTFNKLILYSILTKK